MISAATSVQDRTPADAAPELRATWRWMIGFRFLLINMVGLALAGAAWASTNEAAPSARVPPGGFEGVATVVEGPFLTQGGQRFILRGESTSNQDVCVYAGVSPRPHTGDSVFAVGRITLPQDLSEIGRAALNARGCTAQLSADRVIVVAPGRGLMAQLSRMRTSLSDFLMRSAPGDTGALLSGLVTGDDGGLTEEASDAFLSSGTTHITAISGANFAILTLLLGVMASGAMRRSLWFIGIVVGVIWLYAAMVGMQPSAMRAALLATAVLAGRWLGRIPDLLTLTVLLASMQILIRPQDFQTLAFQLSVSATVALIVVFDGSERVGGRSWLAGLALCVLAAQLATLPVLAAKLGTVSGIGLLANLVVGPLASLAFPLALMGGLVGELAPWIGEVVLLPAIWLADLTVATVRWFGDHLPGSVQLGEPVSGAIFMLSAVCWLAILALSGDLRRMVRHAWSLIRDW